MMFVRPAKIECYRNTRILKKYWPFVVVQDATHEQRYAKDNAAAPTYMAYSHGETMMMIIAITLTSVTFTTVNWFEAKTLLLDAATSKA